MLIYQKNVLYFSLCLRQGSIISSSFNAKVYIQYQAIYIQATSFLIVIYSHFMLSFGFCINLNWNPMRIWVLNFCYLIIALYLNLELLRLKSNLYLPICFLFNKILFGFIANSIISDIILKSISNSWQEMCCLLNAEYFWVLFITC